MTFTLDKLADLTGSKIIGDSKVIIKSVASIDKAKDGDISFINKKKYKHLLEKSKASAVIITPDVSEGYSGNALINTDPYLTFAKVLKIFYEKNDLQDSISSQASISDNASIGKSVTINAKAVIEKNVSIGDESSVGAGTVVGNNVEIGKNVRIHPNVTIYPDCKIGDSAIIHSGAVIGADGFGFAPQNDKSWFKILQIGNVVIGKDVEIGANNTIDRAAMGSTIIGDGVKLDNQIHIGHNVSIGEHSALAACTVIGGSTRIGKRCQIGGASAIAGHLTIVDDVIITGNSMVIKSIDESGMYSSGIPAEKNSVWRRNITHLKQFDKIVKRLKKLENKTTEE